MATKPDGGSAFPDFKQTGMSLRDYFAAKAMAAMLISTEWNTADLARDAYYAADAMIAERAK